MNSEDINSITDFVINGNSVDLSDAITISRLDRQQLPFLFAAATRIREHFFANSVSLCSIINAKSGKCPENCSFCAQSAHHSTGSAVYPLLDDCEILDVANAASRSGASCFGIVTSGSGITPGHELDRLCSVISRIKNETDLHPAASLGVIDIETAMILKESGLVTYHHNLETSRSFFPFICTTHNYDDDIDTVRVAGKAGLRVCSGALFGLGEEMSHRLELAITLRDLNVDSVPVNFLDPVPGTPLEAAQNLAPLECLHTIALYRFLLPKAHITVCGGREKNLRELQSWVFLAGATGIMTGDYLTKAGRKPDADQRMIEDLGLKADRRIF